MEFKSKVEGKTIHGQSREIVANVYKFMKCEKIEGEPVIPLNNLQERVATATGVSVRTVQRIKAEQDKIYEGETSKFPSPKKSVSRLKMKTDLDDFDKGILKRIIFNLHITEKIVPTTKVILQKFSEETGYNGCRESLRTVIKRIGYRWKETKLKRKVLLEHYDTQKLRVNFLRNMSIFRNEGRSIVYLVGMHLVVSSQIQQKIKTEDSPKNHKIIIVQAGGEMGFIPGALLMFKSNIKTEDFYQEMSFESFSKWLREKVIPYLPPRCVVVIGNVPYQHLQIDKAPTSSSSKASMLEWLRNHNIPVTRDLYKCELYDVILKNKPPFERFAFDEILKEHNHSILRMPPYLLALNPLGSIWHDLKQNLSNGNVAFSKFNNVLDRCRDFFDNYSIDEWKMCCDNVKKFEHEFLQNEGIIDNVVEQTIFNLGEDSDDSYTGNFSDSDN